jgi:hypothetical protein
MGVNKTGIVAIGALAAAGAIAVGVSNADASTTSVANTGYASGQAGHASADTPVTGDEAAKVTAAVVAQDSAVTVTAVRKDADGSYDVVGTKAGAHVMFDVSADLATITQKTKGGGRHGGGAGHASTDTPVTGDEAAKVTAAVVAKDSAVTVAAVRKDADGSYDVVGTKAGAHVMIDVSADLATITPHTKS